MASSAIEQPLWTLSRFHRCRARPDDTLGLSLKAHHLGIDTRAHQLNMGSAIAALSLQREILPADGRVHG